MADNTFDVLASVVDRTQCKQGDSFRLESDADGSNLRLVITLDGTNNYDFDRPFCVDHYFPVQRATYNEKTWRRWVFECRLKVENHEIGECFRVGDERPFEPCHGPGEDPYTVHEFRPEVDARIRQDGSIREAA